MVTIVLDDDTGCNLGHLGCGILAALLFVLISSGGDMTSTTLPPDGNDGSPMAATVAQYAVGGANGDGRRQQQQRGVRQQWQGLNNIVVAQKRWEVFQCCVTSQCGHKVNILNGLHLGMLR